MKIILYVTGSISCYKSIDLTRKLVNDGNEVSVVLSQGAEKFLKVDLFLYLGARNAYLAEDDFSHPSNEIKHIELARWCDYFIVCPASANTISHLANGLTKDLGTTIFLALASDKKKLIFPAMNTLMLENKIIKENELEVKNEDVLNHTKELIISNFAQYGQPAPEDKKLEEIAIQVLGNEEERKKVYNQLYDVKTMSLYKEKFTLKNKEVTYDEFVKLASEK